MAPTAGASSFRTARNASILASGQCDRLAKVRLLTLSPTRKLSRSNTAGGEFRFGTRVTYMNPENHADSRDASQKYRITCLQIQPIIRLSTILSTTSETKRSEVRLSMRRQASQKDHPSLKEHQCRSNRGM